MLSYYFTKVGKLREDWMGWGKLLQLTVCSLRFTVENGRLQLTVSSLQLNTEVSVAFKIAYMGSEILVTKSEIRARARLY